MWSIGSSAQATSRGFSLCLLAGAFLFPGTLRALAGDKPEEDAQTILSRAADLTDLRAPGAAPFLMLAKVTLGEGNKSVEGVYAIASAGAGQYRSVFRFPNFTSTEVATDGSVFHQRSTEALPLLVFEASELLAPASQYRLSSEWKIHGVQPERAGNVELRCVMAHADWTDAKICVDAATGQPFSIDRGADVNQFQTTHEHIEFADYQPFEGRVFPHKLSFRGWDSRIVQIEIQKLFRPNSFAADEFSPPKDAFRTPYCAKPQTTGEIHPFTGSAIPMGFRDVRLDIYFQVSPVGGIRYAQVVHSSDPLHNNEILNWFIGTHFPIRSCAGTPISYEMLFTLVIGH
jgi:hypothetical protein